MLLYIFKVRKLNLQLTIHNNIRSRQNIIFELQPQHANDLNVLSKENYQWK